MPDKRRGRDFPTVLWVKNLVRGGKGVHLNATVRLGAKHKTPRQELRSLTLALVSLYTSGKDRGP